MNRLFTAIELPAAIAEQLTYLQGGLEGARWIERDAIHLTLRFIGSVEHHQATAVHEALSEISLPGFEIALRGIGYFGNRKPRALWVGIEPNDRLMAVHAAHEYACQKAGLEHDGRSYTPHVTLARFRNAKRRQLEAYCAAHAMFSARAFTVGRTVLFSARPALGGGPYVAEHIYPLT